MQRAVAFLRDAFDWSGTTGRARFAGAVVFVLFSMVVWLAVLVRAGLGSLSLMTATALFALSVLVFAGHAVRRLHALGRSGAWALLLFVPVLSLVLMWWLLVRKGQADRTSVPARPLRYAGAALLGVFALFIASRALWEPYWIPAGSMKPTLLVGDYIAAVPLREPPQRGDIVIFRHPVTDRDYIKRIVGLAGDMVQMQAGVPVVNGQAATQVKDGTFQETFAPQGAVGTLPSCSNTAPVLGESCLKARLTETLPEGLTYGVLNIRDTALDTTAGFTVPDGHIFVLGDNRDNSIDSRLPRSANGVGFVPDAALKSRAARVIFSSSGRSLWAFWTWRADRFMVSLQ